MLKLRKFLCGSFGLLASLFGIAALFSIPDLIRLFHSHGLVVTASRGQTFHFPIAVRILLLMLAEFERFQPIILAVLYGMAWWSVRMKKPSARGWALAASAAMVFQIVPLSIVVCSLSRFSSHSAASGAAFFMALLAAPGAAGIIAFTAKDSLSSPQTGQTARPPRIAGDGTSGGLDVAVWVVSVAGYFLGQLLWFRWGRAHHLSFTHGLRWWALFAAALLIDSAAHESGHALVGVSLGMRLRTLIVGPFQWVMLHGKWRLQIQLANSFNFGGATGLVPTNPRQSRWAEISMIAAGPFASLIIGCTALQAALKVATTPYSWTWEFLSLVSIFGLVAFFVNLIPARPQALYTDGARIYQLLAGGPWADYYRAVSAAGAGVVTPLRPRDYDIEAIRRASAGITQGHPGLLLRLLAYSHFHDCNQIPDACRALSEAESVCEKSSIEVPAETCALFVVGKAFLAHDSAAAHTWWDRMQGKKTDLSDNDLYWMAKCALELGKGNLEVAQESWEKGNAIVQQRPMAGSYDCNRDCFAELQEALQRKALREFAIEDAQCEK